MAVDEWQENGYDSDLQKTDLKKKKAERIKTLDSLAGTASCFGYKGATLKITIIKDTQGLRSQRQEATTKNTEGCPTEEDSSRKGPKKGEEKS